VPWDLQTSPPIELCGAERAFVVVGHYWAGRQDLRYFQSIPGLEAVQIPSAGFEHAVGYIPKSVLLANGRGVHSAETAELAVGLILAMQRGIATARDDQRRNYWAATAETHKFSSLADRRVLIIGAGSVAKALAIRLEPFEVNITLVGRTRRIDPDLAALTKDPAAARINLETDPDGEPVVKMNIDPEVKAITELPQLLAAAEILVLTVPADAETQQLIGAAELAALPDNALVVNIARGPVLDTEALVSELATDRLRAALDVTDPEPLPVSHVLWNLPNVLITPHVGGNTEAGDPRYTHLVRNQINHLLANEPLENLVPLGTTC
jgi:phosphoglycerate dehydrogenase-like enzyme